MTNAKIIFNQSLELMNNGIIGTTGRTITLVDEDGNKRQSPEPEAIHTFAEWKRLGYYVTKGEKAIARFTIWNRTPNKYREMTKEEADSLNTIMRKDDGSLYKEGDETIDKFGHYYMKEACFFKISQTSAAAKMLPAVI